MKDPNNCRNRSKGSPLRGDSLPKSGNFCNLGAAFPPLGTYWREILYGQADPRCSRLCQISHKSVQRVAHEGRNADFRPLSRFNTGSLPLCGNPTGKK